MAFIALQLSSVIPSSRLEDELISILGHVNYNSSEIRLVEEYSNIKVYKVSKGYGPLVASLNALNNLTSLRICKTKDEYIAYLAMRANI